MPETTYTPYEPRPVAVAPIGNYEGTPYIQERDGKYFMCLQSRSDWACVEVGWDLFRAFSAQFGEPTPAQLAEIASPCQAWSDRVEIAADLVGIIERFRELCEVAPDASDPSEPMCLLLQESEIALARARGQAVDDYGNIAPPGEAEEVEQAALRG